MTEVIVLNVHGGYPSAMIDRSICELSGFTRLAQMSETRDRVYPTNACAGPAFHDTIMDAPIGTMPDAAWHSWAFAHHATRSMFHVFKQNNYETRLIGAFGLDRNLDPGVHMHMRSDELRRALHMYGIDECDPQDASFTCQVAFAHDDEALQRLVSHIDVDTDAPRLTVINLLGCQDAHRCAFSQLDPQKRRGAQSCDELHKSYDERRFSESVLEDDVRNPHAPSHQIDALRRAALTHDWIRGHANCPPRDEVVRAISEMHELCWKCLRRLDTGLQQLLKALETRNRLENAIIYLYSDHAISLYEHGEICEAPWEACLRSFWIRKAPNVPAGRSSTPTSLAGLMPALFADANISPVPTWRAVPAPNGCITLGLACSWLGRASMPPAISPLELRTLFVRTLLIYNDRSYAVTFWFSVGDLTISKSSVTGLDWPNPVLRHSLTTFAKNKALQVFEHTSDPQETNNLATNSTWTNGGTANELKLRIDSIIRGYGLDRLQLRIPENASTLSIDDIDLCAVQLHHRVVRKLAPPTASAPRVEYRSTATQTENTPNLLTAAQIAFGSTRIQPRLPTMMTSTQPLTIFVPDETFANAGKWKAWAPPPLIGAYTRETMQRVARRGLSVTDALQGETHSVHALDDNTVLFRQCHILLQTAVSMVHSYGYAIGYRVRPQRKQADEVVQKTKSPGDRHPRTAPSSADAESAPNESENSSKEAPSPVQTMSLVEEEERIAQSQQLSETDSVFELTEQTTAVVFNPRSSNKQRRPRVVRNPGVSATRPQTLRAAQSIRALESQSQLLKQHM